MFGRDKSEPRVRGGRAVTLLAVIGAVVVVLLFVRADLIELPDWFAGGESDKAPRGTVIYKGQEATAASENFLVDIGDGEAVVSVKAKQNWDKPGGPFSGDFQSTNGTSSVADPEDRDSPASLRIKVDYCSDGLITTYNVTNPDEGGPEKLIRFEMGELFVCNTTLEHTRANDAAFKQDDTPNIFHGEFVTFVARAAEWTAAAAACPTEELEKFRDDNFRSHVRSRLAEQFGLPTTAVEVVAATTGHSDQRTQRSLRRRLEDYANAEDPDHPSKKYRALDIQFLSTDEEAVADSCYRDPGRRSLEDLESVTPPTTTTSTTTSSG